MQVKDSRFVEKLRFFVHCQFSSFLLQFFQPYDLIEREKFNPCRCCCSFRRRSLKKQDWWRVRSDTTQLFQMQRCQASYKQSSLFFNSTTFVLDSVHSGTPFECKNWVIRVKNDCRPMSIGSWTISWSLHLFPGIEHPQHVIISLSSVTSRVMVSWFEF